MGKDTTIEWAHHTFNPWRGCEKVSAGCRGCYAETKSKRNPAVLGEWGPGSVRVEGSENYWKQPLLWNKEALVAGERRRVFCLSLGDVFEDREGLKPLRLRLFALILATPQLDWLLLTKRPELIMPRLADAKALAPQDQPVSTWLANWLQGEPPVNVFLGTSIENQQMADARLQWLLSAPAVLHFASVEPQIGPIDLEHIQVTGRSRHPQTRVPLPALTRRIQSAFDDPASELPYCLDWVICGGESGKTARPLHPDWVRSLQQQCAQAQVSFLFKQWGEWVPVGQLSRDEYCGANQQPWLPEDSTTVCRVGKQAAGRLLDGKLYDEVPQPH